MNEHDPFFSLSEDDRAQVITAARLLSRKLKLPPEAHEEVVELLRQCGAVIADQERKRKALALCHN